MDVPQPEQNIEWFHDGFRVIRVFVQDPMDMTTRERVMTAVMQFREITDLVSLKARVAAIAAGTGLISTVIDHPDHIDPFGEWVTIGFRSAGDAAQSGTGSSVTYHDPWRT